MKLKDIRHIIHVAVIIVVVIVAFVIIRAISVPGSFGQYGHYRGESLKERMDLPVILEGALTCLECHEDERGGMWPGYEVWKAGKHGSVSCANCHGNLKEHVARRRKDPTLEEFVVTKDKSPQKCISCHTALAAKPAFLPLFKEDEHHQPFLELLKQASPEELAEIGCMMCHPTYVPHNPKLAEKDES